MSSLASVNGIDASFSGSKKPIFMITHPRSCSTAFERVLMTRKDLRCVHEPFGDAYYYGPEALGERYAGDSDENVAVRKKSGFGDVTYADVQYKIESSADDTTGKEKRIFIKDMAYYLLPTASNSDTIYSAPSLRLGLHKRKGYGTGENSGSNNDSDAFSNGIVTNGTDLPSYTSQDHVPEEDFDNPTIMPLSLLRSYHFTFLIRHPRRAIPSYYRCCIPPLSERTGFTYYLPSEAGYRELRIFFDYCRAQNLIGGTSGIKVFVLDADDLLDKPKEAIEKYCENIGLEFHESMLEWGDEEECREFDKWDGFHNDAKKSTGLRPRVNKKQDKSDEEEYQGWVETYGKEGADIIRKDVLKNLEDYEYLKGFKVQL